MVTENGFIFRFGELPDKTFTHVLANWMNQKNFRVASQHGEVVMGTRGLGELARIFPG